MNVQRTSEQLRVFLPYYALITAHIGKLEGREDAAYFRGFMGLFLVALLWFARFRIDIELLIICLGIGYLASLVESFYVKSRRKKAAEGLARWLSQQDPRITPGQIHACIPGADELEVQINHKSTLPGATQL
ncbi:MAG: hypothetical protein RL141_302 [Candidatus Parcubacteria bacterium]|jgi:hypothetical protein